MKNITQINILIKRILGRPAMIAVLLIIPAALLFVHMLPEKKQSTEIVSGIYIEENDSYTEAFVSHLTDSATGFIFHEYVSLSDMKDDVASGTIDAGYMIPTGFSSSMIKGDDKVHVTVYTTAGSSFENVSSESVYAALLSAYAADMSVHMLSEQYGSYITNSDLESYVSGYIRDRFQGYIDNDDVFSISGGISGKYSSSDSIAPNNFPVNLLIYMVIAICALLGAQSYLKDLDSGVYSRLSTRGKLSFCIKNIAAGVIPAAIMSFISLIIYNGIDGFLSILIRILCVSAISLIAALASRLIFRHYKVFTIALPILIICTLLPLLLSQLSQM